MNESFLLVALVTANFLVIAGLTVSKLLAPRSYNAQKAEAYECGVPSRGSSWLQFKVGYYLFAILFLMFDVELLFLFPWAVVFKGLGVLGFTSAVFFIFILALGLAYAWRKGALEWK